MACIYGYLRHYRRKNGAPGFTLDEQRAWVREVVREMDFHRERRAGRFDYTESIDGASQGWPILRKVIRMADENADHEVLAVIPTLDGVRSNLPFLSLLASTDAPVYVRCGWRRPGTMSEDSNYKYRSPWLGWLLNDGNEAAAFRQMVERIRQGKRPHRLAIKAGLQKATARGVLLGASRPGSHRFTLDERREGGRVTAKKRRWAANEFYREWIPDILRWRSAGKSFAWIANQLAHRGARKPDGGRIGQMLIYRILKREFHLPA